MERAEKSINKKSDTSNQKQSQIAEGTVSAWNVANG